jgi:hypothetical protein
MDKTLTRTVCCTLAVDGHDAVLATTQRTFNQAATWIAQVCWEEGITNTTTAHHRVYGQTSVDYGLGGGWPCVRSKAVEAVEAIKAVKAVEAVKAIKAVKAKQRETCPTFGPRDSMRYDARTYRLVSLDRVSRNTLDGRVVCRLV